MFQSALDAEKALLESKVPKEWLIYACRNNNDEDDGSRLGAWFVNREHFLEMLNDVDAKRKENNFSGPAYVTAVFDGRSETELKLFLKDNYLESPKKMAEGYKKYFEERSMKQNVSVLSTLSLSEQ